MIKQLEQEGFTEEQSLYAEEQLDLNYMEQACLYLKKVIDIDFVPEKGLYDHMILAGFKKEEAEYAIEKLHVGRITDDHI